MKVSIIVPVYNCENYIKKCIDSLINQTYKNIEIIVVDDGSTDSSYKILKQYKNKIKLIHQENYGVSFSRNIGIKESTGDYIMFVDVDDWIDTDMIEKLYKETNNGKIDIVRCGYIREYINSSKINCICSKKIKVKEDKKIIYDKFIKNYDLNSPCCQIIKKKCIEKLFDETVKVGEDYLFNLDVYTNARSIILLPECYYHYLYNDNSATTSISYNKIFKRCEDSIEVYSKLFDYVKVWKYEKNNKIQLVNYRILKELNMKLLALYQSKNISNKKIINTLEIFLSNSIIENCIHSLKMKTIFKKINLYNLFIFFIKIKSIKLYNFFGDKIYKRVYMFNKKGI